MINLEAEGISPSNGVAAIKKHERERGIMYDIIRHAYILREQG